MSALPAPAWPFARYALDDPRTAQIQEQRSGNQVDAKHEARRLRRPVEITGRSDVASDVMGRIADHHTKAEKGRKLIRATSNTEHGNL
jgi:hypothetical protein